MTSGATRAQFEARELLGCAALAVVLALAMHWPLPMHLGPRHRPGPRRPARAGLAGRVGRARAEDQPLELFQANMFWPMHDSLAFSDALVGYAPAGLIGEGVARRGRALRPAVPVRLRAVLRRRVPAGARARRRPAGRVVAGAAFAYAPWRLEQEGHLHIVSSGGDPARAVPADARLPARQRRRRSSPAGSSRRGSSRSASRSACRSPTCSRAGAEPP